MSLHWLKTWTAVIARLRKVDQGFLEEEKESNSSTAPEKVLRGFSCSVRARANSPVSS